MADLRLRLPRLPGRRAEAAVDVEGADAGPERPGGFGGLLRRGRSAGGPAEAGAKAVTSVITARRVRLVLVLVVLVVLMLVPGRCARNTITEMQQETAAITSVIATDEAEVRRLQSLEDARTEFERDYAAVQAAMPEQPALPELIEQLVALEAATEVRLLLVAPSLPEPVTVEEGPESAEVLQLELSLRVAGDEDAVLNFIDGLRSLPRLVVVDNVGLTWSSNPSTAAAAAESGQEAASARLEATMSARMFMWARESAGSG